MLSGLLFPSLLLSPLGSYGRFLPFLAFSNRCICPCCLFNECSSEKAIESSSLFLIISLDCLYLSVVAWSSTLSAFRRLCLCFFVSYKQQFFLLSGHFLFFNINYLVKVRASSVFLFLYVFCLEAACASGKQPLYSASLHTSFSSCHSSRPVSKSYNIKIRKWSRQLI